MTRYARYIVTARRELNARYPRQFSLRKVAAKVGVSSSLIGAAERGEPMGAENHKLLAAVLSLDADMLELLSGRCPKDIIKILVGQPELIKLVRSSRSG